MTIGRQLKEALDAHRRLPAATARAEILEVLARVRLPEPAGLLKRYPHQLSGGQLQRIVISMALLARPRLLQIGRAHVWTPVPNAHVVCRLLLAYKTLMFITTMRPSIYMFRPQL